METRKKYKIVLSEKYVRKSENGKEWFQFPVNISGQLVAIQTIIPLDPYTEPDLEQIRKEAYEKGREYGKIEGRAEAWNAAKKIALDKEDGGLDTVAYCETFGYGKGFGTVLKTFTASEAIEKIRQYEQEQEEQIQVGDEVENTQTDARFIVTHMWVDNHGEKGVSGFNHDCSAFSTAIDLVRKTGRHFSEIAEVLQKMREES